MNVFVIDEQNDPLPDLAIVDLACVVLRGEGYPASTELAVTFVSPDRISELNEQHLAKSGPTDVLSFPLEDLSPGQPPQDADNGGPPLAIGDILICPAVVRGRAEGTEVPYGDEMALMVVHGLLHLLGYDHEVDADAELMEAHERHYLALVGRTRP